MFFSSNVYSEIDDLAIEIWKSQRHEVVLIYHHKPLLPPPFVIISYVYYLGKYIVEKFIVKVQKSKKKFSSEPLKNTISKRLADKILAKPKILGKRSFFKKKLTNQI
jgi:hypothetical protein